jgi:uncharacterized protein
MLFVIHAIDRDGVIDVRLAHYDAHKAFVSDVAAFDVQVAMSGPLVSDDGATVIGSLYIVEAPNREAVVRFNRADPFYAAGIWESISISAFIRRQG